MAGETPDYRRLNVVSLAYPVTDLGELAARLGALSRFDRRGDVSYFTSFEDGGVYWTKTPAATGFVYPTFNTSRSGILSMVCVAGATNGDASSFDQPFQVPLLGKIGVESTFVRAFQTALTFDMGIDYSDGSNTYRFLQRIRLSTGDVQVLKADNTFATVASVSGGGSVPTMWLSWKMVVDLATKRYERTIIGSTAVDTSQYTPRNTGASANTLIDLRFVVTSEQNGANKLTVVDDVILTQAEPANAG